VQSNHEGELVDFLHRNIDTASGAIVNPAGLTQHGVSLHDAIKAMPFPMLEVHMSNIAAREEWRTHSIISPAVRGTIQGLGPAVLPARACVASSPSPGPRPSLDEADRPHLQLFGFLMVAAWG
jgi:3-dehydroquinate dehydratase-2